MKDVKLELEYHQQDEGTSKHTESYQGPHQQPVPLPRAYKYNSAVGYDKDK